jgi:hypothetical protein
VTVGDEATVDADRIEAELRLPAYRDLTPTLDYLVRTLSGAVYIEDVSGRLLFTHSAPHPDDWRWDFTPLSQPSVAGFEKSLRIWSRSGRTYIAIPGDQSFRYRRTIIPLTYHGQIFAFVHLVNSRLPTPVPRTEDNTATRLVAILGDKLFMLVMGRLNEFRHPDAPAVPPGAEDAVGCAVTTLTAGVGGHPADRILDHESVARLAGLALQSALLAAGGPVETVDSRIVHAADRLELVQQLRFARPMDPAALEALYRTALDDLGWRLNVGLGVSADGTERTERAEAEARALLSMSPPDHERTRVFTRGDGGLQSLLMLKRGGAGFTRYAEHIRAVLYAADPVLATTAVAYAGSECNASDTAAQLAVDRRTVNHRLHRIAEITGLDLPAFPAKIILYLTFLPESPME